MQIIPIRASRPALAPVPQLFPVNVNELAEERHECTLLAVRARTAAQRAHEFRWAARLTARIDLADKS